MRPFVFKLKDLPVPVVVIGENGEREVYQLTPASSRCGASLQKVKNALKEIVLRFVDRK